MYTTAYEHGWTRKSDGNVSIMKSALFGGIGGTLGQFIASPFFMVRNQLQSAAVEKIAVGHQHKHSSMTGALMKIYRAQGIRGLYRGALVTFPRGMMGSGSQIAAFSYSKDLLQRKSNFDATLISFLSGCVAATVQTIVMNPTGKRQDLNLKCFSTTTIADVISTRLYNQGTDAKGQGMTYSGVIDCFIKISRTEGIRGFYKGFLPHYLRMGPHCTLVLVFFDELKLFKSRIF